MINVTLTSEQVRLIGFALNTVKRYETDIQAISPARDEHNDRLHELAEIQNLLLSATCLSEVVLSSWPMKIERQSDGTVYPFTNKNVLQAALGKNITSNQLWDAGYVYQSAGIWERENKSSPVHPSILQESTSWSDYLKREPNGLLTVGSHDIYMSEAHMKECGYVQDGQDSRRWRRKTVVPSAQANWPRQVELWADGRLYTHPRCGEPALAAMVTPIELMLAGYTQNPKISFTQDIWCRTHTAVTTYNWQQDISIEIAVLPLSNEARRMLYDAGIKNVRDLIAKSDQDLIAIWMKLPTLNADIVRQARGIRDYVLVARAK